MDKLAEKIAELSDKYGAHVVDAARGAVRVEAMSSIQGVIIGLIVCALLTWAGLRMWGADGYTDGMGLNFAKAGSVFLIGVASIVGTIAVVTITDPWLWTAFNNPDLFIAKKVLKL